MKLAIGSDKSGFAVKEAVKAWLAEEGYAFDDLGTTDLAEVHPYYRVASEVAPRVQSGEYDFAVLICGTGAGMSVVANKFRGVHAVACEGVYSARMARAINNAKVLCMGGWIVGPEMAVEMVKAFLNTAWCEGLEDWRAENMHKFAAQLERIEEEIYDA
ncbi:MAG: RpiB/LacA/LacB family sugar-phosphate isomerase [Oscillospiraceae bacterium]|nr:RpiB/LacA/LacB family sugar-phosphate isomerase [Oscillospiraceae bacterium]